MHPSRRTRPLLTALTAGLVLLTGASLAQLVDLHDAPNTAGCGIAKPLVQQIGAGRGDVVTPDSSIFLSGRPVTRTLTSKGIDYGSVALGVLFNDPSDPE